MELPYISVGNFQILKIKKKIDTFSCKEAKFSKLKFFL